MQNKKENTHNGIVKLASTLKEADKKTRMQAQNRTQMVDKSGRTVQYNENE